MILLGFVLAFIPSNTSNAAKKYYYKTKYVTVKQCLGTYKISHYCPCIKCCGNTKGITASGTKAKAGRTIGVDPEVIPYGSKVKIGNHTYVAEDTGGASKGKKLIDIFCKTHSEALNKGVYYKKVYLVNKKKVKVKVKIKNKKK